MTRILGAVGIVDLRAVVLIGGDDRDPAITLVCDSMGQPDLGWIEKTSALRHTLAGEVAPAGWRAAAYRELVAALPEAVPMICWGDLIEELSARYWDGETGDEGARQALVDYHGHDPEDVDGMMLPSQIAAARPDFMLAEKASALRSLPRPLQRLIRRLRSAETALAAAAQPAWRFDFDRFCDYLPEIESRAGLPPMTLVPFDWFARELDAATQIGMSEGFLDIVELCPLADPAAIDTWLSGLRARAEVLLAAQELIDFDPVAWRYGRYGRSGR